MIRRALPLLVLSLAALNAACGPPEIDENGTGSNDPPAASSPTPTPSGTPSYRPTSLDGALVRFGCFMDRTLWDDTGMPDIAWQAAESAAGGGRCFSCHETGTGGALLSQDPATFFEMNRSKPYLYKLVLGTVDANGAFEDLVPAWRFRDKGEDPNHPEYILSEERQMALWTFVENTLAKYHQYEIPCESL